MFETFRQRFRDWRLYKRATIQLYDLDDYLLADVGIDRREIRRRVREAMTGSRPGR
jgi:uncharacterized protein YjiS (DUF1127 family)